MTFLASWNGFKDFNNMNYMKRATYSPPLADLFCIRAERGFEASTETKWYENEMNGGQFDWTYGGNEDTWG